MLNFLSKFFGPWAWKSSQIRLDSTPQKPSDLHTRPTTTINRGKCSTSTSKPLCDCKYPNTARPLLLQQPEFFHWTQQQTHPTLSVYLLHGVLIPLGFVHVSAGCAGGKFIVVTGWPLHFGGIILYQQQSHLHGSELPRYCDPDKIPC